MTGGHVCVERLRRLEVERKLTLELIRTINLPTGLHELMRDILTLVSTHTEAEAVGIRLRDGQDYPYFEYLGFSKEFIQAETRLCPKTHLPNQPIILDCMCGNILQQRTDATLPFFTQQGSFWSNCTTQLLASTSLEERQSNTRNRCNGEGYESVALVPLRYQNETFGLIQVNDRRAGRFEPENIDFLERLGAAVAVALKQRQTDGQLQEALATMKVLLNEVHHRVKNSLQLVASLLSLGAGRIADPEAAAVIVQSQERIQAIALAHEMLFASPSSSRVALSKYLDALVDHLVAAWSDGSGRIPIRVTAEHVELGANALVPVGLMVTELVCNALRHAFPSGREGEIRVMVRQPTKDRVWVILADNGIGLPQGINTETSPGFGLRMVGILGKQVGAEVEIDRTQGTTVHIKLVSPNGDNPS